MSQSEEQASPVQIVVMQAEHEMAAVPPADDQMAEAPPEDQIAEAPPEDGITAAGVVEDHITAAGVVEDHITAVAAAAAGVVEEQQIIHVTGVDEHIRNHIVEMENQLRQNVEAVHALQQQNQEIRDALDTSNASIVLLQAELDSRKDELENCQEENKKSRETVETKLRSCQEELQAQSVKGKEMEQKLAETQNSLELKEQEFKELEEKMQEKSEEIEEAVVAPAAQPRVHNTRSRGNQKAKSTTVSTTPATKTKVASAMEIIKQDFVPNTLRFCRTCGAKQLFKVKSEIIGILSGKMELSNRTCAICGNAVSPPKTTSKVKDGEQEESETRTEVTPAKVEKMPKRPSRLAKKRKISDETEEVDNEEAGDKSDKENKGDDMGAPLISYPVDDTPDVDASGDGVAKPSEVKSETGTGEGSETTAGDEGDDVSEPMDTKEDSQNESQKARTETTRVSQ
ncbi:uncharacterized protein [Amphiura filiformis]|uniref:uncharacterized protein n=1 Tax=Amphiura filiformis TaxID=82378 RepID=UPI003B223480